MHYLHKILVYIPDAVTDRDNYERSELIDAIRTSCGKYDRGVLSICF